MGSGSWTSTSFSTYAAKRGYTTVNNSIDGIATTSLSSNYTVQDLYRSRDLDPMLDPKNVMRECRDSEEHPNTIPVIFALDVTGSMGEATALVAKELNAIMTKLYSEVTDVQFMVMGIGDIAYDSAPIQISQFESDIRILEQLEKVWFEGGGGGNSYESYTAAWYMGLRHCDLDCWKRGKKGIIITLGDEPLNPYLNARQLNRVTGDNLQANIETKDLYEEVSQKFDIYHIAVNDTHSSYRWYADEIDRTFSAYLDENHLKVCNLNDLAITVANIIIDSSKNNSEVVGSFEGGMPEINW